MSDLNLPNLAGIATDDLVEKIGTGKFIASYINWARTIQLLREHAPGWMPELVPNSNGDLLHQAPVGAYLLLRFRNGEHVTPAVPQAVMDARNAAIPVDRITARDVTDTHRRGVCMAAAFTFGLAFELWAKLPLESGYADQAEELPAVTPEQAAEIKKLLQDTTSDTKQFLAWVSKGCGMTVASVDQMPASAYTPAVKRLKDKQTEQA